MVNLRMSGLGRTDKSGSTPAVPWEVRERLVRKYFSMGQKDRVWRPAGVVAACGLASFVTAAVVSGSGRTVLLFLGLGLLVGAGVRFSRDNRGYRLEIQLFGKVGATDQDIDNWLQEGIDQVVPAGFERLGITQADLAGTRPGEPGAKPLVIQGVVDPDDGFPVLSKVGGDGRIRYSYYEIMVIYLTEWHLCAYTSVLEMTTGITLTDRTWEFHYQDVVSIATSSDRQRFTLPSDGGSGSAPGDVIHITSKQAFRIRVPGDEVSMLIGIPTRERLVHRDLSKQSGLDNALRQIRKKLNDYKNRRSAGTSDPTDLGAY